MPPGSSQQYFTRSGLSLRTYWTMSTPSSSTLPIVHSCQDNSLRILGEGFISSVTNISSRLSDFSVQGLRSSGQLPSSIFTQLYIWPGCHLWYISALWEYYEVIFTRARSSRHGNSSAWCASWWWCVLPSSLHRAIDGRVVSW